MASGKKTSESVKLSKRGHVSFRCANLMKEAIQAQAEKEGVTVSVFVENAMKEYLHSKGVRIKIETTII